VVDTAPHVATTLACVIQRRNVRELPALHDEAQRLGVTALSLLVPSLASAGFNWELMGASPAKDPLDADDITFLEAVFAHFSRLRPRLVAQSDAVLADYIEHFRHLVGLPSKLRQHDCRVPLKTVTVTERGTLKPCFYLRTEIPWDIRTPPTEVPEFRAFTLRFTAASPDCASCMQYLCHPKLRPVRRVQCPY
jgi:hypothetical protein